jgi:hypothetical protein
MWRNWANLGTANGSPGKFAMNGAIRNLNRPRLANLNTFIHAADILEDSIVAEVDADIFYEGPNFVYSPLNYRQLFTDVYDIPHNTAVEMSMIYQKF